MKIVEDKVAVYPPHAICKADIPVIVSALPAEWTGGISTFRLSAAQKENPNIIANLHLDGTLVVKSRGLSKRRVLTAMLTELAGHALGIKFLGGHRLQKREEARIRRAIAPFIEGILPRLS